MCHWELPRTTAIKLRNEKPKGTHQTKTKIM